MSDFFQEFECYLTILDSYEVHLLEWIGADSIILRLNLFYMHSHMVQGK